MLLSKRSKSDETDAISDQAVVKRWVEGMLSPPW